MNRIKTLLTLLILGSIALIYKVIFSPIVLSGGDYIIYGKDILQFLSTDAFSSWDNKQGLGSSTLPLLHYAPYNFFIGQVGALSGYSTGFTERIVWWIPFLFLAFFSLKALYQFVFPKNSFWWIGSFLFLCNTYILMVISGGQIAGIGLAYSIAPLVLLYFMKTIKKDRVWLKYSFVSGILFAIQVMFDLRTAYITLVAVGFYYFFITIGQYKNLRTTCSILLTSLCISLSITVLLHLFWILPILIFHINPAAQFSSAYTSSSSVSFFSFATFENALSLLHPNWPENIFGKIYFMRPEFILMPILAFSSLLFVTNSKTEEQKSNIQIKNKNFQNTGGIEQSSTINVLFFCFLALFGVFLAKGSNAPFGFIYQWLFSHVPGFIMFRDATKWYLLIAVSFCILIPFTIEEIYRKIHSIKKISKQSHIVKIQNIFLFLVTFFLFFLIRPALFGQLTGVFKPQPIPQEYIQLNQFLYADTRFSRTLWIPVPQRFGTFSQTHPAISAQDFFNTTNLQKVLTILQKPQTQHLVEDAGVKYLVIPDDIGKEIFLKNQHYDRTQYIQSIQKISHLSWVTPFTHFGNIAVFVVKNPKDHFWIANNPQAHIIVSSQNPTMYTLELRNIKKNETLVFSEAYDPYWNLNSTDHMESSKYQNEFNSFVLTREGNYTIQISYEPQRLVIIGLWISAIVLICILIIYFSQKNKKIS